MTSAHVQNYLNMQEKWHEKFKKLVINCMII